VGGSGVSDPRDAASYLIDGGQNRLALIDCGAEPSGQAILKAIKKLDFEPREIEYLILTHCHIDHIGAAFAFKRDLKCKIVAHDLDRDGIEGRNVEKTASSWYGIEYEPVEVEVVFKGEEMILELGSIELHLMHTPGHTPGSIVVWLEDDCERVLFGQDIHGPLDDSFGSDFREYLESLQKIMDLEATILCEGHFGVYRGKERVAGFIRSYMG
jgi:glyoxylase-like metal-dependent hydrolase (beta-lactamase superfamily II)